MPEEGKKTGFWLSGVAVNTAADGLRQAAAQGVLPVADYRQSINGCRICGDSLACHAAVSGDADAACRNAQLIRELTAPEENGRGEK